MGKHTKEPWVLFEVGDRHVHFCPASEADKTSILTITEEDGVKFGAVYNDDDARRIVACVNACAGIGTEHLENMVMLGETMQDRFELWRKGETELTSKLTKACVEAETWEKRATKEASANADLMQQRNELLEVQNDHHRLVRELDVLLNGVDGAAPQASLCDLVAQLKAKGGAA